MKANVRWKENLSPLKTDNLDTRGINQGTKDFKRFNRNFGTRTKAQE